MRIKNLIIVLFLTFGLMACGGGQQTTEEKVEDAVEETGDAMDDAVDETEDAMEDAGDAMEDAAEDVEDAVDADSTSMD